MTSEEFKAALKSLGLKQVQAARLMGYSRQQTFNAMCAGRAGVSPQAARLMRAYLAGYRPDDWPVTPESHQ